MAIIGSTRRNPSAPMHAWFECNGLESNPDPSKLHRISIVTVDPYHHESVSQQADRVLDDIAEGNGIYGLRLDWLCGTALFDGANNPRPAADCARALHSNSLIRDEREVLFELASLLSEVPPPSLILTNNEISPIFNVPGIVAAMFDYQRDLPLIRGLSESAINNFLASPENYGQYIEFQTRQRALLLATIEESIRTATTWTAPWVNSPNNYYPGLWNSAPKDKNGAPVVGGVMGLRNYQLSADYLNQDGVTPAARYADLPSNRQEWAALCDNIDMIRRVVDIPTFGTNLPSDVFNELVAHWARSRPANAGTRDMIIFKGGTITTAEAQATLTVLERHESSTHPTVKNWPAISLNPSSVTTNGYTSTPASLA